MAAEHARPPQPAERAGHGGWQAVRMPAPRGKLYVREVRGRHTRWRRAAFWLTQLVYYGLPWLSWNGRPAVLFDLARRQFHLFGLVLWPQDLVYLAGLLMLCAGLLFFTSALAGRVWCGFGCPHTVYTGIFMRIEQFIEGGRAARMRLDAQPLSLSKAAKKLAKHGAWLALAAWTGITLVGYFTPLRTLLAELGAGAAGPWESFWICAYGGLAYLNAGWMREQFCKYICAYARFQSAMFDRDTLVVCYDRMRGEPRGLRRRNRDPRAPRQGDCVDCTICAQVCPAGIDIRDGLQHECIDCGACIDACDAVMDKLGLARGLIRYSAAHAPQRVLRPRILAYAGLLGAGIALYVAALASRPALRLDVIPDRGPARMTQDGMVENVYRLQIMNMDERPRRVRVAVCGARAFAPDGAGEYGIDAASVRAVAFRVRAPESAVRAGAATVEFVVETLDAPAWRIRERSVLRASPHS